MVRAHARSPHQGQTTGRAKSGRESRTRRRRSSGISRLQPDNAFGMRVPVVWNHSPRDAASKFDASRRNNRVRVRLFRCVDDPSVANRVRQLRVATNRNDGSVLHADVTVLRHSFLRGAAPKTLDHRSRTGQLDRCVLQRDGSRWAAVNCLVRHFIREAADKTNHPRALAAVRSDV